MDKHSRIYIAGHTGMVGSAICRALIRKGYTNLLTKSSQELDLRNQLAVVEFFTTHQPEYVFLAAAKVGGILANDAYRAQFIYDNLAIGVNIIHASYLAGVKKLCFLGSSCIYPKMAQQPLKEEYLLTGPIEPTNEPYAIAKIAGIKLCESYRRQYGCNYITLMPTSLYGFGDNYHPENSHVIPGLIRRFHEAKVSGQKEVVVWGSGSPRREFLFADDLADATVYLMEQYNEMGLVNIGAGQEITIRELARLIAGAVGYSGNIVFDATKPDGTPRKAMDSSKLQGLGWKPTLSLEEGVSLAYQDYLQRFVQTVAA